MVLECNSTVPADINNKWCPKLSLEAEQLNCRLQPLTVYFQSMKISRFHHYKHKMSILYHYFLICRFSKFAISVSLLRLVRLQSLSFTPCNSGIDFYYNWNSTHTSFCKWHLCEYEYIISELYSNYPLHKISDDNSVFDSTTYKNTVATKSLPRLELYDLKTLIHLLIKLRLVQNMQIAQHLWIQIRINAS